jgi:hypothetical protein
VYDKLGVADRLELALYCLNHRVADGEAKKAATPTNGAEVPAPSPAPTPSSEPSAAAAAASASGSSRV